MHTNAISIRLTIGCNAMKVVLMKFNYLKKKNYHSVVLYHLL